MNLQQPPPPSLEFFWAFDPPTLLEFPIPFMGEVRYFLEPHITENKGTTKRTKEHSQGDREVRVFNRNLMHK